MCSSAPAVDNSGQNAAALQQAGLSAEQLAWSKAIYAETADDRAYATEQAKKISDASLESMQVQTNLAKDYDSYNKEVFRPLEKGIVADAVGYDTAERRDQMAGQAIADVDSQAVAVRDQMAREAMARGVDPSSGNFAASQGAFGVREAAAKAAAGNAARTQVETIGAARKMDAANLGRGLASSQATSAGLALTAGNSAGAAAQQPLAAAQSGAQILNSGAAGAQQGLAGAAQTYGQIADNQVRANQNSNAAGLWGALGQVGGAAATAYFKSSDKNAKENIEPVDVDEALDAVNAMPVSNWAYKAGANAADGGKAHTGPMAQDVQKVVGEKIAPKGKKVDLISMNGINMAAIQGLSKKMDRIAALAGITV